MAERTDHLEKVYKLYIVVARQQTRAESPDSREQSSP